MIGTLTRQMPAHSSQQAGGPAQGLVADWLAEDRFSGAMTTSALHERFTSWREEHNIVMPVTTKALAMGLRAAGLVHQRRRNANYWIR